MAIITTITEEPTGPLAVDLPVLLHPTGVTGYDYRWVAKQVKTALGAPIPAWTSTAGTTLTAAAGKAPVLADSSGIRTTVFDGTDDVATVTGLATQRTAVVVVRIKAANGVNAPFLSDAANNFQLVRTAANQLGVFAPGSGKTLAVDMSVWSFVAFTMGATTAQASINGTYLAAGTSTGGLGLTDLRIGAGSSPIAYGNVEVAEIITYPTELNAGDLATVRGAMKTAYPALV